MKLRDELKNYEHIIFDWNGTLLHDVELVCNILGESLTRHELPALSMNEFKDRFSFPIDSFYLSVGFTEDHLDSTHQYYKHNYFTRYKEEKLFEGTTELLKELNANDKKISVLSAAKEDHLHEALAHFDLIPHVHHIYGVDNHFAKGKVERGHELLSQITIPREKTIIVGDTLYDAEVGKSLNIDVLLIADGHQSYEQLISSNCKVLRSRY